MLSLNEEYRVTARPHSLQLSLGEHTLLGFERSGRWTGGIIDGRGFRRSLGNQVFEKWRKPTNGLDRMGRRERIGDEKRDLITNVYEAAREVRRRLKEGAAPNPDAEIIAWLDRIVTWDADALERDAAAFRTLYPYPVSILPPDQYGAVVVQITDGCWHNRCTFCSFYRDRRFRVKGESEVREHIDRIRTFLGVDLGRRRTIFLGDANALVVPTPRLRRLLQAVREAFPDLPMASFLDAFTGRRLTVDVLSELRRDGLEQVYIGLESGNDDLLTFVGKPARAADMLDAVRILKRAGIRVGIIVLIGLGGEQFAEAHQRDTARLVNQMGLDSGDILYFSELVEEQGTEYAQLAHQADIRPLNPEEVSRQVELLRGELHFAGRPPKLTYYHIRDFAY